MQIRVDGIKCEDIAYWFYVNGVNGIGIIESEGIKSVHIDMRNETKYCFK